MHTTDRFTAAVSAPLLQMCVGENEKDMCWPHHCNVFDLCRIVRNAAASTFSLSSCGVVVNVVVLIYSSIFGGVLWGEKNPSHYNFVRHCN